MIRHLTRHVRSAALGVAALAVTASVVAAAQTPESNGSGLATAAGHVTSTRAQQALVDAAAARAAGLAKAAAAKDANNIPDAVPTTSSSSADALASALAAAQAGLAKATQALTDNPTDKDAGGLSGLEKAAAAIAAGLAHAQNATTNAGSQAGTHH